ncbi:hypothetical protein HDU97_003146 [Phlyctochytrium planicorne]|nr:hypothetical protein HDU97_003146 [Phlyctochytrium planicorne]
MSDGECEALANAFPTLTIPSRKCCDAQLRNVVIGCRSSEDGLDSRIVALSIQDRSDALSGRFFPALSGLTNLESLTITTSQIVSILPSSWPSNLRRLTHLDLSGHGAGVSGAVTEEWWNWWMGMDFIKVDGNALIEGTGLLGAGGVEPKVSTINLSNNCFNSSSFSDSLVQASKSRPAQVIISPQIANAAICNADGSMATMSMNSSGSTGGQKSKTFMESITLPMWIGAGVGLMVLIILAIVLLIWWRKRKLRKSQRESKEMRRSIHARNSKLGREEFGVAAPARDEQPPLTEQKNYTMFGTLVHPLAQSSGTSLPYIPLPPPRPITPPQDPSIRPQSVNSIKSDNNNNNYHNNNTNTNNNSPNSKRNFARHARWFGRDPSRHNLETDERSGSSSSSIVTPSEADSDERLLGTGQSQVSAAPVTSLYMSYGSEKISQGQTQSQSPNHSQNQSASQYHNNNDRRWGRSDVVEDMWAPIPPQASTPIARTPSMKSSRSLRSLASNRQSMAIAMSNGTAWASTSAGSILAHGDYDDEDPNLFSSDFGKSGISRLVEQHRKNLEAAAQARGREPYYSACKSLDNRRSPSAGSKATGSGSAAGAMSTTEERESFYSKNMRLSDASLNEKHASRSSSNGSLPGWLKAAGGSGEDVPPVPQIYSSHLELIDPDSAAKKIDGAQLMQMSHEKMRELGIASRQARQLILVNLQKLLFPIM